MTRQDSSNLADVLKPGIDDSSVRGSDIDLIGIGEFFLLAVIVVVVSVLIVGVVVFWWWWGQ